VLKQGRARGRCLTEELMRRSADDAGAYNIRLGSRSCRTAQGRTARSSALKCVPDIRLGRADLVPANAISVADRLAGGTPRTSMPDPRLMGHSTSHLGTARTCPTLVVADEGDGVCRLRGGVATRGLGQTRTRVVGPALRARIPDTVEGLPARAAHTGPAASRHDPTIHARGSVVARFPPTAHESRHGLRVAGS